MSVDPDIVGLFSHHLMAAGFLAAFVATISIRRYGLAMMFLIALIESYANIRYPFHLAIRTMLLGPGYDGAVKAALQMRLLLGAAIVGALILLMLVPMLMRMSTGRRLMAMGTIIIVATLCVELISVHAIDAILYHPIGPFARCAVLYFVAATLVTGGALLERRRLREEGRQGGHSLPI